MASVVIIGAGLTGLSTAYHLEKQGFFDYAIFEKENAIGGLCRTVEQDGFTFDFTGHLLHINDPYFHALLGSVLDFNEFNTINRQSFIYSHNTYTHYPYQINLFGLPPDVISECLLGYINRKKSKKNPKLFTQWALQEFGAGMAKHFFFPYQQKIFAYDVEKISASWTGRFVPATSLEQIIHGTFKNPASTPTVGYNAQFFYPKVGGNIWWVKKFAARIRNPIQTLHAVQTINLKTKTILFKNGHTQKFETLVSTMPLDSLLESLQEKSSTFLKRAKNKLICNAITNFNLGIARHDLSQKHWIYFPENQYPFYRIGFPHNFTHHAAPQNCSSLYGEFAHINKSQDWINSTLTASIAATKKLFNIRDEEIMTQKIINIPHAYVIYDAWRDNNLPKLHDALKQLQVHSIGRYGEWKYSSMQEAILDGQKTAASIIPTKNNHTNITG